MIRPGEFRGNAGVDGTIRPVRMLAAITGVYLPFALGRVLLALMGFVRRQKWTVGPREWVFEEQSAMLGVKLFSRKTRIPAASIVYVSSGTMGDPALLLAGAVWLFALVLFGMYRIHTGVTAGAPAYILTGGFFVLTGLLVDIGCFLLHQKLVDSAGHVLQVGLIDGSVKTVARVVPEPVFLGGPET